MTLIGKVNHGPDTRGAGARQVKSPELEVNIALFRWAISWDVLCGRRHRRRSWHGSVFQIRAEHQDQDGIRLSVEFITRSIRQSQAMLAARQHDPERRREYEAVDESDTCQFLDRLLDI